MTTEHGLTRGTVGGLAGWASLCVGVAGVLLYGSVVGGAGDWVEGRQLQTVAPWAMPGLMLALVSSLAAARVLLQGKGHRLAVLLALSVALSVGLLFLVNPSIAPPIA